MSSYAIFSYLKKKKVLTQIATFQKIHYFVMEKYPFLAKRSPHLRFIWIFQLDFFVRIVEELREVRKLIKSVKQHFEN